jgi:hypothetical protein
VDVRVRGGLPVAGKRLSFPRPGSAEKKALEQDFLTRSAHGHGHGHGHASVAVDRPRPASTGVAALPATGTDKGRGGRPEKPAQTILRSLGPLADRSNITEQQIQILVTLREVLLPGIEVTKHGRTGRPNKRTLFCDSEFTLLYWRAPGEMASPPHGATRRRTFVNTLIGLKSDEDRQILLSDIERVSDDMSTEVMRRSLARNFVAGSENAQVLSILLAEGRSLDLEVPVDHWSTVFHGLQVLVNFYRHILPSVR